MLDVRTPAEFACGHVPGAVNIPLDELRNRLASSIARSRSSPTARSASAVTWRREFSMQAGYDVANLSGGYTTYCQTNGGPAQQGVY